MAEDAEVGAGDDGGANETVKGSPPSTKSNGSTGYLTSPRFDDSSVPVKDELSPDVSSHCGSSQLGTTWKATNKALIGPTRGFHPNRFLQRSMLYRYNKLELSSGPRDL